MNPSPDQPRTVDPVSGLTEHLFRYESARLGSMLTGVVGVRHIQLAEDVVQEALIRAFKTWPYYGIPANPAGRLMRTAKNLALDALRREQSFREKEPEIVRLMSERLVDTRTEPGLISKKRSRMIYSRPSPCRERALVAGAGADGAIWDSRARRKKMVDTVLCQQYLLLTKVDCHGT